MRSTDGGETWAMVEDSTQLELFSVYFADEMNGWVVGGDDENGSVILHTTDGGGTWNPHTTDVSVALKCVRFADANHGWVAGARYGRGVVMQTTDGGASWQTDTFSSDGIPQALAFVDASTGWLVGESGMIARFIGTSDVPPAYPPGAVPREFSLTAYPNPFNPVARLEAIIPMAGRTQLAVYDITGRLVEVLWDGYLTSGSRVFTFDGSKLPSGVYFAHLRSPGNTGAARLVLLR